MERTTIEEAKLIFQDNFIGIEELQNFFEFINPREKLSISIPEIPWGKKMLKSLSSNYILILGMPECGSINLTIRNLRQIFGVNPEKFEPCFYNQDWYLKEEFIDYCLPLGWYLIRKSGLYETRAVDPKILTDNNIKFPPAILCCYTFFAFWFARNVKLWEFDFVWCNDTDHNNDRIYVGKYIDIDGINKNGFSIHRHLALRKCYTAIDYIENY